MAVSELAKGVRGRSRRFHRKYCKISVWCLGLVFIVPSAVLYFSKFGERSAAAFVQLLCLTIGVVLFVASSVSLLTDYFRRRQNKDRLPFEIKDYAGEEKSKIVLKWLSHIHHHRHHHHHHHHHDEPHNMEMTVEPDTATTTAPTSESSTPPPQYNHVNKVPPPPEYENETKETKK